MTGTVYLIGAGPGDPELLTLKALRRLAVADVVVHDRLVSTAVLTMTSPEALIIPVGKAPGRHVLPQEEISALLVALARRYARVVRLKGGDPFIFGRGGEEAEALRAARVPHEIVPGITAAQGAAASVGVPLTHRGLATGVRYLTGQCRTGALPAADWESLADPQTTLVVYMGAASIGRIAERLIAAGAEPRLPVLAVASATTPQERRVLSSLAQIGDDMARVRPGGPVLFIVGRVVPLSLAEALGGAIPWNELADVVAAGHA